MVRVPTPRREWSDAPHRSACRGGPEDPAGRDMTSLNPVCRRIGHDQGQLRTDVEAILTIGGQGPVDALGRLLHEGDMAAQLALALENLTDVVRAAGMTLTDLASLRIHTTDIGSLLDVYFVVSEHLAERSATPPISIIEVSRLAIPAMDIEIEGLAVRSARP